MTVAGATDLPSRFLGDAPTEIGDALDWFAMGQARVVPPSHLAEFLGALFVIRMSRSCISHLTSSIEDRVMMHLAKLSRESRSRSWWSPPDSPPCSGALRADL